MTRKKLRVFGKRANPEKWRPVVVRDALSVKALNALLRKGWYLMDIDMDDLPCLAFDISTQGERPQSKRRPETLLSFPEEEARILLLILTKGNIHRQRAVILEPDEKGYRDLGKYNEQLARVADGWEPIQMFWMENRCALAILERVEKGGESRDVTLRL